MKNLPFFLLGAFTGPSMHAQNLVVDPGFEGHTSCPVWVSDMGPCPAWWAPNTATTDYYHMCSGTFASHVPFNMAGKQQPHGGTAYVGIITQANDLPYTELVQGRLVEPLEKGAYYKVSYHVSLAEVSRHVDPRLGVCFSADSIAWPYRTAPPCRNGYGVEQLQVPSIDGTDVWMLVTGLYKARGDERYIMLGNFQGVGSPKRNKYSRSKVKDAMGYWYIDDVAVVKARNRNDTVHVRNEWSSRNEVLPGDALLLAPCKGMFQEGSSALLDVGVVHAAAAPDTGAVPPAAMLDYLLNFLLQNDEALLEVAVRLPPGDDPDLARGLAQARAEVLMARLLDQGVRQGHVRAIGHLLSPEEVKAIPPEADLAEGRIDVRILHDMTMLMQEGDAAKLE
jgi:hypothetical protein